MMFFSSFFSLFLSGDNIVCLFSAVTSIVVDSLTAVIIVSVVVVTAASTWFTADVLFGKLGFLPLSNYPGPPLFVGVVPKFCFFLLLLLL